jgi:hypothetical protein
MVGSFDYCCACAASGHEAAPPSSVMNSRRLNSSNCIRTPPARAALQDMLRSLEAVDFLLAAFMCISQNLI